VYKSLYIHKIKDKNLYKSISKKLCKDCFKSQINKTIIEQDLLIKNLQSELDFYKKQGSNKMYRDLIEENENLRLEIQKLTNKYVKSQPRVQYKDQNVIYIITTKLLKDQGRYILGKATNLTNRLSTYNKTDEHEVVYYQQCPDSDSMSMIETIVFQKLKNYREQANRERFVLPKGSDVDTFKNVIKETIEFLSK
jgi:hypothetical protein